MKLKLKQIAGSTDSATGPVSYLNSYFNSPMFKKRSEGTDYQGQMDYFNKWSSKYKPIVTEKWDLEKEGSAHLVGTGMIRLVKPQARELKSHLYNEILPHEYTHLTRHLPVEDQKLFASMEKTLLMKTVLGNYDRFKSNRPDSNMDFNNYLSTNYQGTHDMEPNEQYADLNSLRWMMAKEGIYDTRKGNLDMPTFQKVMSNPKIKDSYMFQRLMKHFSPEDLIKLNNEVAYNSSSGGGNMAQNATKLNPFAPVVPRAALTNQRQYGGSMKQYGGEEDNTGDGDAYDFGSSVLQNYASIQQDRQEQPQTQPEPAYSDVPDTDEQSGIDSEPDKDPNNEFPIADANYFARKEFEMNGTTHQQEQIDDLEIRVANLQSENSTYQALLLDNTDNNNDDDDDGSGYYAPSGTVSSPSRSNVTGASMAVRNNNPGNIKYGSFTAGYGAQKGDPDPQGDGSFYARFPTVEAGLKAHKALLTGPGYRNLTVGQAMNKWITGNPNKTGAYSKGAVALFGNRTIADMSDQEIRLLQNFMIKNEDSTMAHNLGIRQSGGDVPVAEYPADKYHGLNNETLNELLIRNSGKNNYRGLDSGQPVHLYDERGVHQVLFGPDDMATLYGNVYEHR